MARALSAREGMRPQTVVGTTHASSEQLLRDCTPPTAAGTTQPGRALVTPPRSLHTPRRRGSAVMKPTRIHHHSAHGTFGHPSHADATPPAANVSRAAPRLRY